MSDITWHLYIKYIMEIQQNFAIVYFWLKSDFDRTIFELKGIHFLDLGTWPQTLILIPELVLT